VTGADTLIHCAEQVWDGRADIRLAINKNYDPSTATVRNEKEVDPHRNASPTRHGETEVDATSMAHAKDDSLLLQNANVVPTMPTWPRSPLIALLLSPCLTSARRLRAPRRVDKP
jgi:hypothetical protein